MSDDSKTAAAILAAEAARQKLELNRPSKPGGYNIAGELLTYYRYFLGEMGKERGSG